MSARDLAASTRTSARRSPVGRVLPIVAVVVTAVFLLAPWSLEAKAHAALHGLCTQRPSHSLALGDRLLPFDARMTGIYGGFMMAAGWLVARRRLRSNRPPPPATMIVLGSFVGAMGVDGLNSLLLDLGHSHPYEPDNRLRLATGLGTGVALAVVLAFLLATTLWRPRREAVPVVGGLPEVGMMVAMQAPFAAIALSGWAPLYAPVTTLLLVAAVVVVAALALVVIVLVKHGDGMFTTPAQIERPAAIALLGALLVMAAFAGGRFLLERLTGVPPLT